MNNIDIEKRKLEDNAASLSLNGKIVISTVKETRDLIMKEAGEVERFEVDLKGICGFDTSGVQLIIYLMREFKRMNKKLIINSVSSEIDEVCNLYGLKIA